MAIPSPAWCDSTPISSAAFRNFPRRNRCETAEQPSRLFRTTVSSRSVASTRERRKIAGEFVITLVRRLRSGSERIRQRVFDTGHLTMREAWQTGVVVEVPNCVLVWDCEPELAFESLGSDSAQVIKDGEYYSFPTTLLNGWTCRLALSFDAEGLCRVQVCPSDDSPRTPAQITEAFWASHDRLLKEFGTPSEVTEPSTDPNDPCEGFPGYLWNIGRTRLTHAVIDRFATTEIIIFARQDDPKRPSRLIRWLACLLAGRLPWSCE